jgi:hypothetical protein
MRPHRLVGLSPVHQSTTSPSVRAHPADMALSRFGCLTRWLQSGGRHLGYRHDCARWATVIHQIGVPVLPGPQTDVRFGELLRPIGLVAAPGLLNAPTAVVALTICGQCVLGHRRLMATGGNRAAPVCVWASMLMLGVALGVGLLITFHQPQSVSIRFLSNS